jgi:hypothetical protein
MASVDTRESHIKLVSNHINCSTTREKKSLINAITIGSNFRLESAKKAIGQANLPVVVSQRSFNFKSLDLILLINSNIKGKTFFQ